MLENFEAQRKAEGEIDAVANTATLRRRRGAVPKEALQLRNVTLIRSLIVESCWLILRRHSQSFAIFGSVPVNLLIHPPGFDSLYLGKCATTDESTILHYF